MSKLLAAGRGELIGLGLLLALVLVVFGLTTPRFLSFGTFQSMAFQLPELGLLTLAMLVPILSGGLNLAITFQANACALAMAAVLQAFGGPEAGMPAFLRCAAPERRGRGRRPASVVDLKFVGSRRPASKRTSDPKTTLDSRVC